MEVYHITPAYSDKNWGKAINDMIELLPDDSWIALRDIDTLPVNHVAFISQCKRIAETTDYDLIGCMTNRVGVEYLLLTRDISRNYNMLDHYKIGERLAKEHDIEVVDCPYIIGGFFMLFNKKLWKELGGFRKGLITKQGFIDYLFCKKAIDKGKKLGIAKGIYMYHSYRNWIDKAPRMHYEHLK